LHTLRSHRAGDGAEPTDRARNSRPWTVSPRAGLEVLRSFAAVPSIGDLWACGSATGALHAGGMGGWLQPVAEAAGRSAAPARDERGKVAWG